MRALLLVLALAASACRYPNADDAFGLVPDEDGDGFSADVDCDDSDDSVHPDADEVCNGVDDDCDGDVDIDALDEVTFWVDGDGDGFGDDDQPTTRACEAPAGHAPQGGDCDDSDKDFNPDAIEINDDGIDQDCNGADTVPCFKDEDHDGFGNDDGLTVFAPDGTCDTAQGESDNDDDCLDTDPATNPDGIDVPTDLIDQDCSGAPAVPCWFDDDGDGQGTTALPLGQDVCGDDDGEANNDDDCDDTDATVKLGATELCDGQLNACGGTLPADEGNVDGDAFVACALDAGGWDGPGTVTGGNDCDDTDDTVFPGATERCDGQLNACGGAMLADEGNLDGDAFVACALDAGGWDGPGTVTGGGDCNDTPPNGATVFPGATELCDGIDNDCDTALLDLERDDDGDTYVECVVDAGGWDGGPTPSAGIDCNDAHAQTFPGAPELCDGIDNNCASGVTDEALTASYQPVTGPWVDVTSLLRPASGRGQYTSEFSGTLWLCPGTWYADVGLFTPPSFTVAGRGAAGSVIVSGATVGTTTPAARVISHTGNGALTVTNLTLRHSTSGNPGGAIRIVGSPSQALIEDCTIESSNAPSGGGLALNGGGALTVRRTTFTGNTATADGGALHVNAGALTLDDVSFEGNGADRGGGLFLNAGTVTGTTVDFTGNTADRGGGFYQRAGTTTFTTLTATQNVSDGGEAEGGGGGALAVADGELYVYDCSITDNDATGNDGGALLMDTNTTVAPSALFTACDISGNTAFDEGGAIACFEDCEVIVTDTTVTDNTAVSGAIDLDAAGGTFSCLITEGGFGAVRDNIATGDPAINPRFAGGAQIGAAGAAVLSAGCHWGTGTTDNMLTFPNPDTAADVGGNNYVNLTFGANANFTCSFTECLGLSGP